MVYIREAHPSDGRRPAPNAPKDPKTLEERELVASDCVKSMKLSIPFLIDGIEDAANKAYAAWPDRIYIVGKDGKIAYKGGMGPGGFKPAEARDKLAEILGRHEPAPGK